MSEPEQKPPILQVQIYLDRFPPVERLERLERAERKLRAEPPGDPRTPEALQAIALWRLDHQLRANRSP